MAHQNRPRPRRGQTIVEFALTLPLLLLLLFGVIEFGRIFQAWVTLQNAARTAARFATTGQYDQTMFPPGSIDSNWSNSSPPPNGTGMPCRFVNAAGPGTPNQAGVTSTLTNFDYTGSPTNAYASANGTYDTAWFFREHWGFFCNGSLQDHQYLRQDVFRLVGITKSAQQGAAGLAIGVDSAGNLPLEIPGTGIGTQVTWKQGDTGANLNQNTLLYESENQRGWFHVFICSTRLSLGDGNGNVEDTWDSAHNQYTTTILPRYYQELDHTYVAGHQNFGLCSVQEGGPDSAHTGGPHAGATSYSVNPFAPDMQASCPMSTSTSACGYKHTGINQYDAGGPGDFVSIIVYFNHPLITPLGLVRDPSTGKDRGFIQLQARRVAINESFRTAKAINLSHPPSNQPTPTPYPSPTITPTFTPTQTFTNTATNTPTLTATNTFTFTPTQTFTKTQTLTPTFTVTPFARSGDILYEVWEGITGNTISSMSTNNPNYGAPGTGAGTPTSCSFLTTTDGPFSDTGGHDSFGARLSGFIVPPADDTYTFYMAYNDKGEFFLSNDTTPGSNGWAVQSGVQGPNSASLHLNYSWTSGTVSLQGGHAYFFYVLEKQDTTAYNITLAWNGTKAPLTTQQVISAAYLSRPTAIPACSAATTTPTPSITYTPSVTLTLTRSLTPSITPTPSRTLTITPSLTPSTTLTPSLTLTSTRSLTPSITPSRTPSLTPSNTNTFTPTFTNSPTFTSSPTKTPSLTPTRTTTPSPSPTSNNTATFTSTPTPTNAPPTDTPPPFSTCGTGGCGP